jgi:hypothetical protein
MVQIQELDPEIKNFKGVQNHLADILRRTPRGMIDDQRKRFDPICPSDDSSHPFALGQKT